MPKRPRIQLEQQVLAQAPEGAHGYQLEIPPQPGGKGPGGRPIIIPRVEDPQKPGATKIGFWTIRPFQPPTQVGEGTYRILWVDLTGKSILPRDLNLLPALHVWWWNPSLEAEEETEPPAEPDPLEQELAAMRAKAEFSYRTGQLRQATESVDADLDKRKAEALNKASEADELAKMREMISNSAQRELAMAASASAQAQRLLAIGDHYLSAIEAKAEALRVAPPPAQPLDWTKPVTELVKQAGEFGQALVHNDQKRAKRALKAAGKVLPGVVDAPDRGETEPAETEPAPQERKPPDVVEVPVQPPQGAAAFAELAKNLNEEERQKLDAAMRDPERMAEFIDFIRGGRPPGKKTEPGSNNG